MGVASDSAAGWLSTGGAALPAAVGSAATPRPLGAGAPRSAVLQAAAAHSDQAMAHFTLCDRLGRRWVFFRPAPLQIRERAADLPFQWAAGAFLRSFTPEDLRAVGRALCALGTTLDRMADEAVVERLERDLASGWLVVCDGPTADEAIEAEHALVASVLRPEAESAPASAGTRGARDEERTWFEVRVVDELGEPIAGLRLVVDTDGKQQVTTDGSGSVRIDDVAARYGWARIEDLDGLRELVGPRWDEVREGEWLAPAPDHTFMPLRGDEPIQVSLLSETPHTIVVQPWVVRARLLGLYFETNKCFLLPLANDDVASIKAIYQRNHPAALLCVGHTDTSGDPSYNDPLSVERADAVAAYLRDDIQPWLDWYGADRPWEKRWGPHEDQLMLTVMPGREGPGEGEPDVIWYRRTRGLEVDGDVGTETRKALIAEYMDRDGAKLPKDVELGTHGCGESFPLSESEIADLLGDADPTDEATKQLCRRVELYFFDQKLGVQPPAPGPVSPPGSTAYPEWERRARETYDYHARPTPKSSLWIRFEIAPDSAPSRQDELQLFIHGGAIVASRSVGADHVPNDCTVDVHLCDVPEDTPLTLEIVPCGGDPPYRLFENLTLGQLKTESTNGDGAVSAASPMAEWVEET